METLGMPLALLCSVAGAFSLIMSAVDRLNGFRDLVLDITERAKPLAIEHREMYLKHNFEHLLCGLLSFCAILALLVAVLPEVTGQDGFWPRASAYAIALFILGATVSIFGTALKDRRRMIDHIQKLRERGDDSASVSAPD